MSIKTKTLFGVEFAEDEYPRAIYATTCRGMGVIVYHAHAESDDLHFAVVHSIDGMPVKRVSGLYGISGDRAAAMVACFNAAFDWIAENLQQKAEAIYAHTLA